MVVLPSASHRKIGARRQVVLHADDFGMNRAVTEGILRGFVDGLLTSTSVLANAPEIDDALSCWQKLHVHRSQSDLPSAAARRRLDDGLMPFDFGVHLNLTQGRPITGDRFPAALLDTEGMFPGIGAMFRRLVFNPDKYARAIDDEFSAQIEIVLDHRIAPTHLNGHQYIELLPGVGAVVMRLQARYAIPVVRVACESGLTRTTLIREFQVANWCLAHVKRSFAGQFRRQAAQAHSLFPAAFFGTSHAGRITLAKLRQFLALAPTQGITEIGMHPGLPAGRDACSARDVRWADPLAGLRPAELNLLTSPELIELFECCHVTLARLRELPAERRLAVSA